MLAVCMTTFCIWLDLERRFVSTPMLTEESSQWRNLVPWSCTERACAPQQCTPGDTMNDGCNTCSCNESGLWLCTTRACVPTEAKEGEACSMHGTQCEEGLECAYTCPDPNADPANCNLGINPSGTCVSANLECTKDADCITAGCSGQICQPASQPAAITTCEFRPEYACYRPPTTNCQCNSGVCGWAQTQDLQSCLNGASAP